MSKKKKKRLLLARAEEAERNYLAMRRKGLDLARELQQALKVMTLIQHYDQHTSLDAIARQCSGCRRAQEDLKKALAPWHGDLMFDTMNSLIREAYTGVLNDVGILQFHHVRKEKSEN